jgi:HPt (histidine-containing phosphotransfer) domain-containing protein
LTAAKPEFPLDPEEFRRRLGAMHARYRARMPEKIAEIEALWQRVKQAPPGDESREALLLATHTLTGSSPTLGCEALGAAAGGLEAALRKAFARNDALSGEEAAAIDALVDKLGQTLD